MFISPKLPMFETQLKEKRSEGRGYTKKAEVTCLSNGLKMEIDNGHQILCTEGEPSIWLKLPDFRCKSVTSSQSSTFTEKQCWGIIVPLIILYNQISYILVLTKRRFGTKLRTLNENYSSFLWKSAIIPYFMTKLRIPWNRLSYK